MRRIRRYRDVRFADDKPMYFHEWAKNTQEGNTASRLFDKMQKVCKNIDSLTYELSGLLGVYWQDEWKVREYIERALKDKNEVPIKEEQFKTILLRLKEINSRLNTLSKANSNARKIGEMYSQQVWGA